MFTEEEGWDCVMDRQDGWVKTRMKAEQREEGEHLGGRFSPRGWEDGEPRAARNGSGTVSACRTSQA